MALLSLSKVTIKGKWRRSESEEGEMGGLEGGETSVEIYCMREELEKRKERKRQTPQKTIVCLTDLLATGFRLF